MFDRLWLLFAKGTQGVCGGVEEVGAGFQQWGVTGSQAHKEDRVRSENPPYISAVLKFVGGGSVSVLRMRDLAEA